MFFARQRARGMRKGDKQSIERDWIFGPGFPCTSPQNCKIHRPATTHAGRLIPASFLVCFPKIASLSPLHDWSVQNTRESLTRSLVMKGLCSTVTVKQLADQGPPLSPLYILPILRVSMFSVSGNLYKVLGLGSKLWFCIASDIFDLSVHYELT